MLVYKKIKATIVMICLIIPMLIAFAFDFFDVIFFADKKTVNADIYYAIINSLSVCVIMIPFFVKDFSEKKNGKFKNIIAIIFVPFLSIACTHSFFSGPVLYGLHILSDSVESESMRIVTKASEGSKYCRNEIILENPTWRFKKKICNASITDIDKLRYGGSIKLSGTKSVYGFHVIKYEVISYNK